MISSFYRAMVRWLLTRSPAVRQRHFSRHTRQWRRDSTDFRRLANVRTRRRPTWRETSPLAAL